MELKQVENWYAKESSRQTKMIWAGVIFALSGFFIPIFLTRDFKFLSGFMQFFLIAGIVMGFNANLLRKQYKGLVEEIKDFYDNHSKINLVNLRIQNTDEKQYLKFGIFLIFASIIISFIFFRP